MDRKPNPLSRFARITCVALVTFSVTAVTTQALAKTWKQPKGRTLVMRLVGAATMAPLPWEQWPKQLQRKLPEGADCYKAPIYDASGSIRFGTGISCLSDRVDIDDAITVLNTVLFRVPGGVVLSQGRMTAQPVVTPTIYGGVSGDMTHIVGALPEEKNVVYASRRFKRWAGWVRSSGFVDLSGLDAGKVGVDIVYTLTLRRKT